MPIQAAVGNVSTVGESGIEINAVESGLAGDNAPQRAKIVKILFIDCVRAEITTAGASKSI